MNDDNVKTFPGFPSKPTEAIIIRDRIRVAIIELHTAMRPMLEVLGSSDKLTMNFTVAGDKMQVSLAPGKPNDETRRTP